MRESGLGLGDGRKKFSVDMDFACVARKEREGCLGFGEDRRRVLEKEMAGRGFITTFKAASVCPGQRDYFI
jgi:hypothetical protein